MATNKSSMDWRSTDNSLVPLMSGNEISAAKAEKVKLPDFQNPDELVTFLIGPSEKKFLVHKEAACQHSPVLKAAFNSKFIEGETQTYRLEDTTEDAFRYLVQWFYGQRINFSTRLDGLLVSLTVEEQVELLLYWSAENRTLCTLWILADKLLIPAVQNIVMDKLGVMRTNCISCGASFVFSWNVQYVYRNTDGDSPLRQFLVEYLGWRLCPDEVSTYSRFPKDFFVSLAIYYSTQLPEGARMTRQNAFDIAKFHVTRDVGE